MQPSTQFNGLAVLVTGASGFIGSHLCSRLNELGARVHGVSRSPSPSNWNGSRWWQADLTRPEVISEVIQSVEPTYVFHLAGHVSGSRDLNAILPTFAVNLSSTVYLLSALAGGSCRRVVLAGSIEEPSGDPDSAIPGSPYAAAKSAASMYARFFHALYSVPVVTARICMVFGPDQKDLQKLIPYVILSLLLDRSPHLSSGERPVDWIYVDDVVEGLLALAATPGIAGQSMDLGTGELVTIRRVVELIRETVGGTAEPLFGTLADRPMESVRQADLEASFDKIGWKPATSLNEGLRKTVRWYRDNLADLAGSFD